MRDDGDWIALVDRFQAAALGLDSWEGALADLATATGSRSGQLIGLGSDGAVPFNYMSNIDPDCITEFAALGGGDPEISPRVRAGVAAGLFEALVDADYMTPEEHRTHPLFTGLYTRYDIPFICQTNLVKENGFVVGMAVNRSHREGHAEAQVKEIVAKIAPHVRTAVRTQMITEGQGAQLIAGAMEAASLAVFVCDRSGCVMARTAATEALLEAGVFRLVAGRLHAPRGRESAAIEEAVLRAGRAPHPGEAPFMGAFVLTTRDGRPLVVDVVRLPRREHGFGFDACSLVIARTGPRTPSQERSVLTAGFGLTPAEADVAIMLLAGRTAEEAAVARGASFNTVRSQIKSAYAKLGVSRFAEMAALLREIS